LTEETTLPSADSSIVPEIRHSRVGGNSPENDLEVNNETQSNFESTADSVESSVPLVQYLKPIFLIIAVLFADQALKFWVKTNMEPHESIRLIDGKAMLYFIENNGIAFGLELPGVMGKLLLTTFRIVAAGLILYMLFRLVKRRFPDGFLLAGGLVFAGAVGNIIDSIFYGVIFRNINDYAGGWLHGKVVDMLYFPIVQGRFPNWLPIWGGEDFEFFRPIFNLADSSITVGILIIIFFYRQWLRKI
jgi:signal peptidase II